MTEPTAASPPSKTGLAWPVEEDPALNRLIVDADTLVSQALNSGMTSAELREVAQGLAYTAKAAAGPQNAGAVRVASDAAEAFIAIAALKRITEDPSLARASDATT